MWIKYLAGSVILAGVGLQLSAKVHAQETPVCPDGAADAMFQFAAQAPQIKNDSELQATFGYAKRLPEVCPDDPIVHYFSAHALLAISDLLPDPGAKFERLREAIAAFESYDATADHDSREYASGVKDASGADMTIETYNQSYKFMSDYLGPKVVWFEANGFFHDWVSASAQTAAAAPDKPCPYVRQDYATAEAHGHYLGHSQTAPIFLENGANPNPLGSIERIELLASKCPDARQGIYFELAHLNVMFAEFSDTDGKPADENGYIDRALAAIESFLSLAAAASETETHRYGIAVKWKTEMLALKGEAAN